MEAREVEMIVVGKNVLYASLNNNRLNAAHIRRRLVDVEMRTVWNWSEMGFNRV